MSKKVSTVSASSAKTANGYSAAVAANGRKVSALVDLTAVSGTTPSMTVFPQWSHDGTTWFYSSPSEDFAAMTAAVKLVKTFDTKAPYFRLGWTVTGTTPSFTFAAYAYSPDE